MLKIVCSAFLLVVAVLVDGTNAKGLPSYLKLCKRDSTIDKCIQENVELLRPKLKQGIPELFIPAMDPLVIPEATLNSGDSFKAIFRNIQLYHVDNFQLESFKVDLDRHHINLKLTFPSLRIKSEYNLQGRLLVLNLNGTGPADGNYTNVHTQLSLKGAPYQKNNKEYIRWEQEKMEIKIENIHLNFERIFGDNEELNERTNKIINENWETIVDDLLPVVQQVVSSFIFNVVNRLFGRYSSAELFPSS